MLKGKRLAILTIALVVALYVLYINIDKKEYTVPIDRLVVELPTSGGLFQVEKAEYEPKKNESLLDLFMHSSESNELLRFVTIKDIYSIENGLYIDYRFPESPEGYVLCSYYQIQVINAFCSFAKNFTWIEYLHLTSSEGVLDIHLHSSDERAYIDAFFSKVSRGYENDDLHFDDSIFRHSDDVDCFIADDTIYINVPASEMRGLSSNQEVMLISKINAELSHADGLDYYQILVDGFIWDYGHLSFLFSRPIQRD